MHKIASLLLMVTALFGGSIAYAQEAAKPADSAPDASVAAEKPEASLHPQYKMVTSEGDIVLELDAERAPLTVLNFDQYVTDNFFDNTIFHRVISNFMIQGGGFEAGFKKKTNGLRGGIANEWKNGLKNDKYTISMARIGGQPDSGSSQFFINVADNAMLDRPQADGAAYAVFGKVVKGEDIVEKIKMTPVRRSRMSGENSEPVTPPVVKDVEVIIPLDREAARGQVGKAPTPQPTVLDEKTKAELEKTKTHLEAQYNAKFQELPNGLSYLRISEGTDAQKPVDKDKIVAAYRLSTVAGLEMQKWDKETPFEVPRTSQGEALKLMEKGEKGVFIIPAQTTASGKVTPPLVFEVELKDIKKAE